MCTVQNCEIQICTIQNGAVPILKLGISDLNGSDLYIQGFYALPSLENLQLKN